MESQGIVDITKSEITGRQTGAGPQASLFRLRSDFLVPSGSQFGKILPPGDTGHVYGGHTGGAPGTKSEARDVAQ